MSNYILSYPHSGNTWLRYCVEYVTMRKTGGHRDFSISERRNNFLNVDLSAPPVAIKRHELELSELKSDDNLILLIRSPYECIKDGMDEKTEFLKYYSLLITYDRFKGRKSLLEYNWLFDSNLEYLEMVLEIFGLRFSAEKMEDLSKNFTGHLSSSAGVYKNVMNRRGASLDCIPKGFFENPILKGLYGKAKP